MDLTVKTEALAKIFREIRMNMCNKKVIFSIVWVKIGTLIEKTCHLKLLSYKQLCGTFL